MEDRDKTKQQLLNELIEERGRSAELELKLQALTQTQEALRITEERLELALSGAEVGLWDYNLKTGEAFISPQRAAMIGYSVDELEPHFTSWGKLVHPEDIGGSRMLLTLTCKVTRPFISVSTGCAPNLENICGSWHEPKSWNGMRTAAHCE